MQLLILIGAEKFVEVRVAFRDLGIAILKHLQAELVKDATCRRSGPGQEGAILPCNVCLPSPRFSCSQANSRPK